MAHIFLAAGIISALFFIAKFIEMRFIEKENKPLKFLVRDSLVVYFSVISGNFILEQLNPIMEGSMVNNQPSVFTDNPGF